MKKRWIALCCMLTVMCLTAGCGSSAPAPAPSTEAAAVETEAKETEVVETEAVEEAAAETEEAGPAVIPEDGVYWAEFDTDSSMFHVNEAYEGKGILTVENGEMTIHVSLVSKNIVNLYLGSAEEAPDDEMNWIEHTEDEVTYKDGWKEVVYGFDIPVESLDREFSLALIGTHGNWYDHTVSVSNPEPYEE